MDRTQSQWLIDKHEALAENGMVTAMHPLAAAAGLDILRAGGNAVDAAVATVVSTNITGDIMRDAGATRGGIPESRNRSASATIFWVRL